MDHYPISTIISTNNNIFTKKEKRRNWNKVNLEKLLISFRKNYYLLSIREKILEPSNLDKYINRVLDFINLLGEDSTPIITNTKFRNPWWSKEIDSLIKTSRKNRRLLANKLISREIYKESLRKKEKAIKLAKDIYWRKEVEKISKESSSKNY